MRKDRKDDQNRWLPTPDEIFGDITVGPHQFLEHRKFKDVDCRARCCASLAMVSKCFSKMQSSKSTPMMGTFPHYSHTTSTGSLCESSEAYKFHGFGLRNCMADPTSRTGPKELATQHPRQFASLHKTSHADPSNLTVTFEAFSNHCGFPFDLPQKWFGRRFAGIPNTSQTESKSFLEVFHRKFNENIWELRAVFAALAHASRTKPAKSCDSFRCRAEKAAPAPKGENHSDLTRLHSWYLQIYRTKKHEGSSLNNGDQQE